MRKTAIMMVVLFFAATLVICGKVFAQDAANDSKKSVKALEATKITEATESTETTESSEATIPYSAPYNSPDMGADQVEVDEDA